MTTPTTSFDGYVAAPFRPLIDGIAERGEFRDDDIQIAAYAGTELVLDIAIGPEITRESLLIPYSVSKNTIAVSIGLLLERGLLDLDVPVAHYWPEFAAAGKAAITVRQLLSHQAGLPQTAPRLMTRDELADTVRGAELLAAQRPLWHPGSAFGYHAVTIGILGSEIVRRITGRTLAEFYEQEIRGPRGLEFYLGLPEELEPRAVDLLPMRPVSGSAAPPFARTPGQLGGYVMAGGAPPMDEDERRRQARRDRAIGMPAAGATTSARGIAALFAESTVGLTSAPLLSADTIAQLAQPQVAGIDEVIGIERRYGVVFQKPVPGLLFGGFRAFGHDGMGGALGFHDPETGISFGYVVRRMPPPGGCDARALRIAQAMRSTILHA
ncbi:serine hydrolase domain-containing protein [Nonomuraea guangzhouensis]|uniref:Serine hydrolase domain-containing protein n=1 Tax=Nonomuraea guangzhouensis TaxID=1291555 RepID=A0ABW4GYX7_9ACTN|nr:serine hydrolase domain-containing protein [Nonomuraea guangzhouensis]